MKLALIRRQFSPVGGAELYLQRLLVALAEAGHELHLVTESWPAVPAKITVHMLPSTGSRAERPRQFAEAVRRALSLAEFDCVFSLERTLKQDVYRAGDGVHRVWLQRRREFAPVWRRPFVGRGQFHKTMLALEAETFSAKNTGHIIANSEMVKREILEHFSFPAERIHVVRNGVDVARFRRGDRAGTRTRLGLQDDDYLMLFVGSGWERKGLPYLLEALRRCQNPSADARARFQDGAAEARALTDPVENSSNAGRDATEDSPAKIKLLVVGKGRPPMTRPKNVLFPGPIQDIENAYAAADLMVFLPIYEPSANVVPEALAAGLPVVTSAQNGASEGIKDGVHGTVVSSPTDFDAIVRAIGFWQARRGRRIGAELPDLSLERNVRETMAILESAAREKSG